MAQSFIGKPISLVSHSDVRYRGILAGIDPAASTIQLSNVYSMGTESRRPPAEFIPPVPDPYQYIIFRASEVKDLAVDEPAVPTHRSVHDDPAVLAAPPPQAHAPAQQAYTHPVPAQQPYQASPVPVQQPQPQPQPQPQAPPQPQPQAPPARPQQQQQQQPARRPANANANSVHTAAASLETVERALGDLRVSNTTTRGRGRGTRPPRHAAQVQPHPLTVPTTDFDFASMNAKFDKAALGTHDNASAGAAVTDSSAQTQTNGTTDASAAATPPPGAGAYDPSKSFFDSLSPTPMPPSAAGAAGGAGAGTPGVRGRRGGRDVRSRREEERERNVATFGEPGGAHAHAHVGSGMWGGAQGGAGGYARRGGARGGRRGGVVGVGVGARV